MSLIRPHRRFIASLQAHAMMPYQGAGAGQAIEVCYPPFHSSIVTDPINAPRPCLMCYSLRGPALPTGRLRARLATRRRPNNADDDRPCAACIRCRPSAVRAAGAGELARKRAPIHAQLPRAHIRPSRTPRGPRGRRAPGRDPLAH